MSKKKLVSILLSAVLCFGMLGGTFVYYIARYKNGAFWHTGGKYLIAPGHGRDEKNAYMTKKLDYKTDWFLKLNPEGKNTKGCDAWGYMRNA